MPRQQGATVRRIWRMPALLLAVVACRSEPAATPTFLGQWVWTARDASLLQTTRRTMPTLHAGVWVATIEGRGDSLVGTLGRPIDATMGDDVEAVIRIDDSFTPLWGRASADVIAAGLEERLRRVLSVVEREGAVAALQLDYDAPVSRLGDYAALLARLRAPGHVLAGRHVWVTSLVAHLADPDYGKRLRPLVDGHIVQLFDTGDSYTSARVEVVRDRLRRAAMPFRVGVGAFERRLARGETTHRAWFGFLPIAAQSPWFRGAWIFPGGEAYQQYLTR